MSYYHLTIDERCCIYNFHKSGLSLREIAKALNRNVSTISRELKRNKYVSNGMYHPTAAQNKYTNRRKSCHRYSCVSEEIRNLIEEKIKLHWSPEQIYNRLKSNIKMPSTSTIYRMIHKKILPKIRIEHLRRKGGFKRPAETRGKFNVDGTRAIKKRPREIYKRKEIGHWEGDTVESGRNDHKRKSKYCFVTLVERVSRYYIAILVPSRTSENVTPAIINALKDFPDELVKTITFDRGKEFSGYKEIEEKLNCRTYFCDPYCAWQKGSNENSNGLLREFYPKGMDLSYVNKKELEYNLTLMNNRPRKCIGFKTPKEILLNQSLTKCCT